MNALSVKHPFADQIPLVGDMLNMQQVEGFGDTYMPAVQAPSFGAHPLSKFFTTGFNDYATHAATPLLPSQPIHSRTFYKKEVE